MKMVTSNLKDEFAELAALHGKYSEMGDGQKTNLIFEQLISVVKKLREESDHGESTLTQLVTDKNLFVVCYAATYLLPIHPESGEAVLSDLAEKDNGLAGFDAKTTLQEWKTGRLKLL